MSILFHFSEDAHSWSDLLRQIEGKKSDDSNNFKHSNVLVYTLDNRYT